MGSTSGDGKVSLFWVVGFPLVLFVLIGGFVYYKVTSAVQASGAGLIESHARDPARSQAGTDEADRVTATLVEFAKHVKEGQLDLAQKLAARPYRDSMDPKRFAASLNANPYLKAGGTLFARTIALRNGTGRWDGTLGSPAGAVTVLADFSGEPEGWRLTSLMVGGMQTFPAF